MRSWKNILAPVLVFVLGAICGGAATAFYAIREVRAIVRQDGPADPEPVAVRILARRLELDPEQRAAAQPIFVELAQRLNELRMQSRPQVNAAVQDAAERLRPLLRAEQQERLEHMLTRWEHWEPLRHRRRMGPPPSAPPNAEPR